MQGDALIPAAEAIDRFRKGCEALIGSHPARAERFALAVSGGPDSVAMLLLAAAAFPGRIAAATVDHGLRTGAAAEAQAVAALCAALGVPHRTLRVEQVITANVQAEARAARYALLGQWCAGEGLHWLLTAHHLDDQAETLLMRLLRGSGLAGLAGVRARNPMHGPILLRPLLGWRRAELAAIVAAAGIAAADDPSNRDPHYDRARLRRNLRESTWIEPVPIARSAAALAEAEEALAWTTNRLWNERVTIEGEEATLDPAGLPPELIRRLLTRLFARYHEAPRGEQIQRLILELADGQTVTQGALLCGGGALWRFGPAPPRRQP